MGYIKLSVFCLIDQEKNRPLISVVKGGFRSEEAGGLLHCQDKYSKSLSWAENLNFPPKTVNKLFKFSTQDSDLEYLSWQCKKSPVSSDFKPTWEKMTRAPPSHMALA